MVYIQITLRLPRIKYNENSFTIKLQEERSFIA